MTEVVTAAEVYSYWFETLVPDDWYRADDALDNVITDRFLTTWETALNGGCQDWIQNASGSLSFIVLTDQFPRNMFRGNGRSFATDTMALAACKTAIQAGWDLTIPEPHRQFFYMPFMHAEDLTDQDACLAYVDTRMPETKSKTMDHAHAHRWVIAEFGRFPYRNAALDRTTTPEEQRFLDAGGYGYALEQVRKAK